MTISGLAHCCHHDVHWEFCYDFEERVRFIKKNKPISEQPLRLKLFGIVPDDKLPGKGSKARAEYDKARAEYDKARAEYDKARAEYTKALAECDKARAEYTKARAGCDKARAECNKALAECNKARAEYDKALAIYLVKYSREMESLHAELWPDCTWNGRTIFGRPA